MSKTGKIIFILIMTICLTICGFSAFKLYGITAKYKDNKDTYEAINKNYVQTTNKQPVVKKDSTEKPDKDTVEPFPVEVDFTALRNEMNPEIIAWLYCPDTDISYPVMQHDDNFYYLDHDATGAPTSCGAIFLNYTNYPSFTDFNNIIHGHHLNNGQMFGSFAKWSKQDYFDTHNTFWLSTFYNGDYKIELIAYFDTPEDSYAYAISAATYDDVANWVQWVKEQSVVKSDYEFTEGDRFVTMSTCMYSFENARGVLIGHLVPLGEN